MSGATRSSGLSEASGVRAAAALVRRRSSQSLFRRFSASRSSATSTIGDDWEKDGANADPLALGNESKVVKPPTQWLAIMGPRASGKSTLIRQLKIVHDGADVEEALRCAPTVRKVALDLVKEAAKEVAPRLTDNDAKEAAERLQALRRRAQLTAEVAADVQTLWRSAELTPLHVARGA